MRSRFGIAAAAAVVLALSVGACGDDSDDGGDDGGPVELTFSFWGSDSRLEYTQQLIDLFEQQNPGITVEPIFTDFDAYWEQLATSTAGDNAPDVITMEERFIREYVVNGQLLDLSTVSDVVDTSNIDPLALAAGQIDNGLYTIASGVNAFSIVVDPQIFEETGVPLPDDNTWTWEDYVSTAVQISEAGGGDVFGAQAFGTNENQFNIYARQRGEQLYNPDGSLGFTAQTLADWWTLSLQQTEQGGTPPAEETIEIGATGPDESLLATNRGAMGQWWTNQLGAISGAAGRDLVLLRQPGEFTGQRPGMFLKPAMSYSISARTDHTREAAMFVNFMLNSTDAAEIMLNDRGLSANLQVREHVTPLLEGAEAQVAEFMAEITPDLVDPPPAPPQGAGDVVDIIQRYYEQILFGDLDTLEAAEQFMAEVDAATT